MYTETLYIMDKKTLRKTMLARRLSLRPEEARHLGDRAQTMLIQSEAFRQAQMILLYAAFRGEVSTNLIAEVAVAQGKGLCLPRVQRRPPRLWFHRYPGDPAEVPVGEYGIREPAPDWPLVEPGRVDLVVVPGLAFDRRGMRLGFGAGYYDRTLPRVRQANPRVKVVGLAYACQLVYELPAEPHDIPVDAVATELGIKYTEKGP